ncbi:hypothetical protein VME0621_05100 [Vibrio mediterranei]|uniref:DUF4942 domain-containing protein n=1 Tax=Vibrio mediterranei TaxID=689 RepID=UPI000783A7D7|nr:DUF4942 domain-containing protein [Vibrio mediterranei]SBO12929.1 hypothetical protein VME0621_05100 [Vibrio mediterranei]
MNYQLKEKLNAKQICERRNQIEALLTQAISLLGEADSLMKTISNNGLSFDRNTFYSPSEANQRHRSLSSLTKQVDQKLWQHIIELGQFRDLMSADKRAEIDKDMENPPSLTYATLTATFNDLLNNRVNMLQDLTESVFKNRNSEFKSNRGHKLNKRLVFHNVFCKYGWRYQSDLLEDACKIFAVLTGCSSPEIVSILSEAHEPLIAFDGNVKFVAYQNGNVHVWILDNEIENKVNDILNGCFDGQLPNIAA